MFKDGKEIPFVRQEECLVMLETFLQDSEALVCHDKVDFTTLQTLVENNLVPVPSYEKIDKVDSQDFYKFIMREEYGISKYGMAAIVQQFGSYQVNEKYNSGAHGALCDAEVLAQITTSQQLKVRFKDWLSFGKLQIEEIVKQPQTEEIVKPSVSCLPC